MACSPKFFGTFKQVASGTVTHKVICKTTLKFVESKQNDDLLPVKME